MVRISPQFWLHVNPHCRLSDRPFHIGWGLFIDAVGGRHVSWLGLDWNGFSLFFAAVALVFIAALVLARRLEEPDAASLEKLLREILIESPQRFLVRLWQRE